MTDSDIIIIDNTSTLCDLVREAISLGELMTISIHIINSSNNSKQVKNYYTIFTLHTIIHSFIFISIIHPISFQVDVVLGNHLDIYQILILKYTTYICSI